VPPALPAGTVSVSFTNRAPPAKAGFILLVGRVKPGAHYTLAAIRANKVDLTRIADIVVAAQPDGSRPAYATVRLTPGDYVITSPSCLPPPNPATASHPDDHGDPVTFPDYPPSRPSAGPASRPRLAGPPRRHLTRPVRRPHWPGRSASPP
jgi:hypothetical protein